MSRWCLLFGVDHHHPILGGCCCVACWPWPAGRPVGLFCSRYWNQHTKYTECAIHSFLVSQTTGEDHHDSVHTNYYSYTVCRIAIEFFIPLGEMMVSFKWIGSIWKLGGPASSIAPSALTHEERKRQRRTPFSK